MCRFCLGPEWGCLVHGSLVAKVFYSEQHNVVTSRHTEKKIKNVVWIKIPIYVTFCSLFMSTCIFNFNFGGINDFIYLAIYIFIYLWFWQIQSSIKLLTSERDLQWPHLQDVSMRILCDSSGNRLSIWRASNLMLFSLTQIETEMFFDHPVLNPPHLPFLFVSSFLLPH